MYRVLIVDDEPDIRIGIRMKVDWEKHGLEVSGEASNGREALDLLAANEADIVITDMSMPVMDGVAFLEACSQLFPELRTIVITGYEDFQYARAALKSKARDYLLKPVARDELEAALEKVVRELDAERQSSDQKASLEWKLSQYYKEMKEHVIVQILTAEKEPGNAVRDRARLFELDEWEAQTVRFITAGIRDRLAVAHPEGRTPDKLALPFELICREFAEESRLKPLAFHDAHYPLLMHFIVPGEEADCEGFAEDLRACIAKHLQLEPAIGIGQPVQGFSRWRDGCLSALLGWNLTDTKLPVSSPEGQSSITGVLSEEATALLRKCLLRGDLIAFGDAVKRELVQAFGQSQADFVKVIFQLYLMIDEGARETGVRLSDKETLWVRPDLVLGLHNVAKAEQFLLELAAGLSRQPGQSGSSHDQDRNLFQAVQQYIDSHYMYDLNLTMLAERFSYYPSYFSELFKSKMGKTFVQYVTEVRMNQATRLLEETSLSLWDIAELTGFSNASYFSSKFKKQYGISPSDYRQSRQSGGYEKNESEQPKK